MCWKYELLYVRGACFDHVWGLNVDDGIKDILKDMGGVNFIDEDECRKQFFKLLCEWHEKGLIKPAAK